MAAQPLFKHVSIQPVSVQLRLVAPTLQPKTCSNCKGHGFAQLIWFDETLETVVTMLDKEASCTACNSNMVEQEPVCTCQQNRITCEKHLQDEADALLWEEQQAEMMQWDW